MIQETCAKCHQELKCIKNGVYLVHFYDDDPSNGIDAVRVGDVYECPVCKCRVVLGLSQQYFGDELGPQMQNHILENYNNPKVSGIIIIKRK